MKKTIMSLLCSMSLGAGAAQSLPADAVCPDWQSEIPRVVYPDSDMVNLYEKTWEIASGRVRKGPEGLAASPYLDENCYEDQIWIWDGCFMVLFSKYAPKAYPGKETLMNLYAPIHDGKRAPLRIHLRDNPPLFAWVEHENYRFSGDRQQIDKVLFDKQYLQRHFIYFDTIAKGNVNTDVSPNPIHRGVVRDSAGNIIGYTWTGNGSGMDNTTRGRDKGGWGSVMWIDAISQQALSALHIAELLEATGHKKQAREWKKRYEQIKGTVNERYWDEQDGYYYDVSLTDGTPSRVMTPASFWAMMAGIPSKEQAARMVEYLKRDDCLGGERPWVTVARRDKDFDAATGNYWRGGIWLPTAYMGTKALEKYGYYDLADELAERVVRLQLRTYKAVEPHTIWECYNPSADEPSTEHGHRARPDFCGWSALGPISLFIENIMGFRSADANTRTVTWSLKAKNGTHGLRNFRFGDIVTDIVYHADRREIVTTTNAPYTLKVNGKTLRIRPGTRAYAISNY